jgi:Flp pilus assembly protein TadD
MEYVDEIVAEAGHHHAAGNWQDAKNGYEKALSARPNDPRATHFLGLLLHEQGEAAKGGDLLRRSLQLNPLSAEFHSNAGAALGREGKTREAIELLDIALRLKPDYTDAMINRALALQAAGRSQEALDSLARAAEIDPACAQAHYELGRALAQRGRGDEAIGCLRSAVRIAPTWAEAHRLLGELLLRSSDFEAGWAELEWGLKPARQASSRRFPQPQWMGSPVGGRTLLVTADCDDRTTIQLIRYVRFLSERGASVVFECEASLVPLVQRAVGITHVAARGQSKPEVDFHVDLTALPLILGRSAAELSSNLPYVRADREGAAELRKQLGPGRHVGIAWRDAEKSDRSIPLHYFSALSSCPGVHLIDLQAPSSAVDINDVKPSMTIAEFEPPLCLREGGLAAVADFLPALDLVVAADTVVAHLAGALGIAVWVAIAPHSEWRWPMAGGLTPWYATMTVFHALRNGDWGQPFQQMAARLRGNSEPAPPGSR